MNDSVPITIECSGCGYIRSYEIDPITKLVRECPKCGETKGPITARPKEELEITSDHSGTLGPKRRKSENSKRKRYLQKITSKKERNASERMTHTDRNVDNVADWYDEVVRDAVTGEIIHECHEQLSKHKGHGSAKPKEKE